MIRAGLRALIARDRAVETWLREQVVPAAVALDAHPDTALTVDEVRQHLVQRRRTGKRTSRT